MFRFFVDNKQGDKFLLPKETIKHINVARVANKEFICTHDGIFYVCTLEGEWAKVVETLDENHEFSSEVVIAQSIIDTKRFEWLIQKASELGATKFIPVMSENVSKKISGDIKKKVQRWNTIASNASEQSFRNVKMMVEEPMKFTDVVSLNVKNKFIAHEKTNSSVRQSFPVESLFLIGPEGGFSDSEINLADQNNFEVVNLGKRILRAETAGMFVLARIND